MSTGFRMPKPNGSILVGIQESFQPSFLPTALKFHQLGYKVCLPTSVWKSKLNSAYNLKSFSVHFMEICLALPDLLSCNSEMVWQIYFLKHISMTTTNTFSESDLKEKDNITRTFSNFLTPL